MKISFHKPYITQAEIDIISTTIKSGWLTMGPKTIEFEKAFKSYMGTKYAVSTNSATAALHLALNAIGIEKDDEVILPTNTFVATIEAVVYSGARPILCDIENENHNINIDLIEKLITPRTKAVIPVHFGGHPCDMNRIISIAHKHNLKVIEDAAHALPSSYKNRKIGTISDATCFSFYATKTLTTGEGGMVTTNNEQIAEKISLQRLHGIKGDAWKRYEKDNDWYYEIVDLGYKYNTTDIQSAMGIVQLEKLEWMKNERKKNAEMYLDAFAGNIECINEPDNCDSSWHLFVIKVSNRDELYQKLKEDGISTSVHFIPIHKHSYYKDRFAYSDKDYPVANNVYEKCLSLPIYPGLINDEVNYIIQHVLQYVECIY